VSGLVIIDSGGANLGSVRHALQRLGVDAPVTRDKATIRAADRLILPGVGAAAPIMQRLRESGVADLLRELRQPLLGICVGMQVLFERSAEGDTACLGLLEGAIEKIAQRPGVRVPHMGWNRLHRERESPLLDGIDNADYAYFVHSYAAPVGSYTLASCDYGNAFSAVVQRDNFYGAQFHPERSASVGARLLQNFIEL